MDTSPAPERPAVSPAAHGRWRAVALATLAIAACLHGVAARADEDPPGRVGRVAEVSGDVRTVDPEGAWVPLPRNQPLSTGDRVITDKEGRATVQIGSSTLRVGPYSDVSITQLDDQKIRVHFDHGQMAVRVRSAEILGELSVETDEGAWVPHHPGYFRFDRTPGQVLAAQAWSGDLLLEAPDSSLPVAANQRAEVWREGARQATHYRLVAIPADAFADWALVQDRLDDRYATAAESSPPAEMTGASDLGRYGQWSSSNDYGSLWTPDNVAPGWAPYQDGSWSWVSPWGWTWVDNAAWGFAPFHYGRWVWIHGRWAWAPGRWGTTRPVYAPALVGWLGGDALVLADGPAVGWVALAPFEPFCPGYAVSHHYWNLVNGPNGAPPIRRSPGPVKGRPRFVPVGPVTYANRGVPGAVAIVPARSLVPHAPVATMPAMQRPDHRRALGDAVAAKATILPPPGPPVGHSALAARASVVQVPIGPGTAPAPAPAVAPTAATGQRSPMAPAAAAAPALAPAAPVVPVATARPGSRTGRPGAEPQPGNQAIVDQRPPVPPPPAPTPPAPAARPVLPVAPVAPVAPMPAAPRPITAMPAAPAAIAPMPVAPVAPAVTGGRTSGNGSPSRSGGADQPSGSDSRDRR